MSSPTSPTAWQHTLPGCIYTGEQLRGWASHWAWCTASDVARRSRPELQPELQPEGDLGYRYLPGGTTTRVPLSTRWHFDNYGWRQLDHHRRQVALPLARRHSYPHCLRGLPCGPRGGLIDGKWGVAHEHPHPPLRPDPLVRRLPYPECLRGLPCGLPGGFDSDDDSGFDDSGFDLRGWRLAGPCFASEDGLIDDKWGTPEGFSVAWAQPTTTFAAHVDTCSAAACGAEGTRVVHFRHSPHFVDRVLVEGPPGSGSDDSDALSLSSGSGSDDDDEV